jgi:O-antigen/teichoic acid export membrane protein
MQKQGYTLRRGALYLFGGSLAGRGLSFLLNTLLSRLLGPDSLGLFSLVLTTSQTFEITVRGGVDYGLQCELTNEQAKLSEHDLQRVASAALQWISGATVFISMVLVLWVGYWQGLLPNTMPMVRELSIGLLLIICCSESLGGLPWDLLLIKGKSKLVSLKQGLFAPVKLAAAVIGGYFQGIEGALIGYALTSIGQTAWVRRKVRPYLLSSGNLVARWSTTWNLIKIGLPLYATNSISAVVFLPLLAGVAVSAGISDVGYLRIGQLVVQLFTLIPGAIAPVLFLRLRQEKDHRDRTKEAQKSLQLVWTLGLIFLLIYCLIDRQLILLIFGEEFLPSLQATRVLVLCAILDSCSQILYTPLLASQRTRLFATVQNSAAIMAGLAGWALIPEYGLTGFLLAKLIFAWIPITCFSIDALKNLKQRHILLSLLAASASFLPLCWSSNWGSLSQQFFLVMIIGILIPRCWHLKEMVK